jgi:hypothetical protein
MRTFIFFLLDLDATLSKTPAFGNDAYLVIVPFHSILPKRAAASGFRRDIPELSHPIDPT